ncbi:MAG: ATP-binding protein [Gemmatimonadales bacterium]
MTPLGLRVRLALVFTTGFAILLGLGALAVYIHLSGNFRRDFDHGLRDAARGARALWFTDRLEFTTAEATAVHVVSELMFGDRTLVAYDSTGRFLASSQRFPQDPWFNDAPPGGPTNVLRTLHLKEGRARVIRVPITEGVEVVVAMSLLPLEHQLAALKRSLATVLPLALVLGAILGAWSARIVLRPIVAVAGSAERIGLEVAGGATTFDRLPAHHAGDEITTLTGAFNRLVDRLSAALSRERAIAERQRQFLADVAHELRTPVAILRSEAEVALAGPMEVERYQVALQRVAGESSELGTLVADLLLVARADINALKPARLHLYLDDLASQVLTRARVLPQMAGREVRFGEFEAAPADGDQALIERAVLVLVHNALVHAPGAPIEISTGLATEGTSRWAWITVRDFGPGIPATAHGRVFERFTRLDPGTAGTGLGLAIARSIAEVHGGTLTLTDATPGASFTFRIPATG